MESAAVIIAIVLAGVGVGYAMSRASRVRKELPQLAEQKPPKQSKRQKRLEQIRAVEPEFTPPTIEDLILAEIADEKIDQIDGAADIQPAVLLKAYRRHESVARNCPPDKLRFIVADGVDAADAEVDDISLTCDAAPAPGLSSDPSSDTSSDPAEKAEN